jgi:ketosteroid isomerase-like protein
MRRSLAFILAVAALAAGALAEEKSVNADLKSMVETELAFAATSKAKGTRASFVAFLADDSVMFRPRAVRGKEWWEQQPDRPGLLSWYPSFAGIAASGEMGYTTGPWEFRPKGPDDKPVGFGYFVTVWKRQPDNTWKVHIDLGTSNPQPAKQDPVFEPSAASAATGMVAKVDVEAERAALMKLDAEFAKATEASGAAGAYATYLADDARYYREGIFPAVGKAAIREALPAQPNPATWQVDDAGVARSGDLGFSYGVAKMKQPTGADAGESVYVRVWRKQADGKWKVVLDITNEIPPPKPAS